MNGDPATFRSQSIGAANIANQLPGSAYDQDGNPTTYNGINASFDGEKRMTAYGSDLTNGYRGDGLRGWKQDSSGRTYFLYSGSQRVCEMNSSGSCKGNSMV